MGQESKGKDPEKDKIVCRIKNVLKEVRFYIFDLPINVIKRDKYIYIWLGFTILQDFSLCFLTFYLARV